MTNKKLFAKEQIEKISRKFMIENAGKITDADIRHVIKSEKDILKKFEPDGPLGRLSKDVVVLNSLVGDYSSETYTEISREAFKEIVFALSYVLNPIDLIPDPISEIGYLDDFAVMAVCLAHVGTEIDKYKAWKLRQGD